MKDELDFSYRSSIFKNKKDYVIVEVSLKLEYGDSEELLDRIKTRRLKRLASQPLDMPSAGSVFRNPPGFSAGRLVQKANLQGEHVGDAYVSEKHANFIVNMGNASGEDVIKLIGIIKDKIKKEYGIELTLEQEIIR
jgi:UDP-N-acetylmuramate dehydrogenase